MRKREERARWSGNGRQCRGQPRGTGAFAHSEVRRAAGRSLSLPPPMALTRLLRLRNAASGLRMGNSTSISTDLSHSVTANQIQETISKNCVVIFSKTTCSYCNMAKKLFEDMNVNYTAVELDTQENGKHFQDVLHQMTGGRTVPRVFINGAFVGGATDTQRLHQQGKLLPLVHQCKLQRPGNSEHPCSIP